MNEESILKKLRSQKTFTVDQVQLFLHCSPRTARRRMKAWKVFTSVNQNGRYYVLPDIPAFNASGLWKYRNILFSTHGTLKQTIIHVIQQSHHGLSSHEITDQIGLPHNRSLLSHLRESSEIRREKFHAATCTFQEIPKSTPGKSGNGTGWKKKPRRSYRMRRRSMCWPISLNIPI